MFHNMRTVIIAYIITIEENNLAYTLNLHVKRREKWNKHGGGGGGSGWVNSSQKCYTNSNAGRGDVTVKLGSLRTDARH